jgi:MFS family permease
MFGMKNKDLIMFGIIIGIALIFIGAIVNKVFPSSSEDFIAYRVQAFIKMIGFGFLTSSMVVGGIIIEEVDKNQRILLLIFGLILLLIYTIGSIQLNNWNVPSGMMAGDTTEQEAAFESRPTELGTPGFEFIFGIVAMICVFISKKIIKRRR